VILQKFKIIKLKKKKKEKLKKFKTHAPHTDIHTHHLWGQGLRRCKYKRGRYRSLRYWRHWWPRNLRMEGTYDMKIALTMRSLKIIIIIINK
jgi:hypothetical protein